MDIAHRANTAAWRDERIYVIFVIIFIRTPANAATSFRF
jgi:hypothetical protein